MLILTRKENEGIIIKTKEGDIIIKILEKKSKRTCKISIEAPVEIKILREELCDNLLSHKAS